MEILESLKNESRKEVARKYQCDLSTISRILKNEEKIRKVAITGVNTERKRLRKSSFEEIDKAMILWFREMRSKNAVISGPMIKEQAKKFSQALSINNFEPTNGWICRWKSRHNINFQKMQGEKVSADDFGANQWTKNILPGLLKNMCPNNVYNADESSLFYRALPTGTMSFKGENPKGGKLQKDRITLLFLCNMDGSDKKIFAIGRSKQPHCFRGKDIPVKYYANRKAWMTSSIWTEILCDLDKTMSRGKRNIVLFVDNAACHKLDGIGLTNITIHFLPPNTTCLIQPLDQGIIRCFKVYYRQNVVRQQLLALEKGETLQEFIKRLNILEALKIVKRSWWLVTPNTIKNCFRAAGFSLVDDDQEMEPDESIQLPMPAEDFDQYVDCDANIECYGALSIEEIITEVQGVSSSTVELEENVTDDEDPHSAPPTRQDALSAVTTLRAYLDAKNQSLNHLEQIEDQMIRINSRNLIQKNIMDYYTHQ